MLKCKVCDCEFNATVEGHYISRDEGKIGLSAAIVCSEERKIYDTFDCPQCGCQFIAQERKRAVKKVIEEKENEE